MDEEFCDGYALAVLMGASITVRCWLKPDHDGVHESPDFTWADGEPTAHGR